MTTDESSNVFLRNDTILGTFQAIGDDFGINPNWLRVPLAAAMLASPTGAVVFYLGLSVIVLASRILFRSKVVPVAAQEVAVEAPAVEANDDQRELIAA
jgi:phage shock protein C